MYSSSTIDLEYALLQVIATNMIATSIIRSGDQSTNHFLCEDKRKV